MLECRERSRELYYSHWCCLAGTCWLSLNQIFFLLQMLFRLTPEKTLIIMVRECAGLLWSRDSARELYYSRCVCPAGTPVLAHTGSVTGRLYLKKKQNEDWKQQEIQVFGGRSHLVKPTIGGFRPLKLFFQFLVTSDNPFQPADQNGFCSGGSY